MCAHAYVEKVNEHVNVSKRTDVEKRMKWRNIMYDIVYEVIVLSDERDSACWVHAL
jgi:hypothetical protein